MTPPPLPGAPPPRANSDCSTVTVHRRPPLPATNPNITLTMDTSVVPLLPPPVPFREARDGSTSSRDSLSRVSLRREVSKKQFSLTVQEQRFLDQLVVHGNDIEVQLAMERLQDEDLFFDNPTNAPRQDQEDQDQSQQEQQQKREGPSSSPRPGLTRSSSLGSLRRLEVLAQRKQSTQHTSLWKAHATGLAVTSTASRRSLLVRRESSESAGRPGPGRPPTDIFRNHRGPGPGPASKQPGARNRNKIPRRRLPYRRSQSLHVDSTSSAASTSASNNNNNKPPAIPPPVSLTRRSSTNTVTSQLSRSKSVTFHDDTNKPRPTLLERLGSNTILPYDVPTPHDTDDKTTDDAAEDVLRPMVAERQESASSIPSLRLRHAHPIRQDSISSIASLTLHHGHPIRQDSVGSLPSLHHGHPIRQDSVGSLPSLHHGHPIRQDSVGSLPSLHHGHPIRQDSVGSLPSLHHGHVLTSTPSPDDFSERNHHPDAKALFLQQYEYAASDDIANAWLLQYQQEQQRQYQQEQQQYQQGAGHDFSSVSSLPDNVTFPSTDTADTTQTMSAQDNNGDPVVSPLNNNSTATTKGLVRPEDMTTTTPLPLLATAITPPPPSSATKPVLVRLASRNAYNGEGMEVMEVEDNPILQEHQQQQHHQRRNDPMYMSMISMDNSIRTCSSWDDQSVRHPEIFRGLRRSLSDEDMTNLFLGTNGT
jgi:hypothetical protein